MVHPKNVIDKKFCVNEWEKKKAKKTIDFLVDTSIKNGTELRTAEDLHFTLESRVKDNDISFNDFVGSMADYVFDAFNFYRRLGYPKTKAKPMALKQTYEEFSEVEENPGLIQYLAKKYF